MLRNSVRAILAAIGLGLLVLLVLKIGPHSILIQLTSIRTSLPLLILIGLVRLVLQTWNWSMALSAEGILSTPQQLAGARLASTALSYLSCMGPVIAEPVKIALLPTKEISNKSAPATLAETVIYWFTSVLLGILGILAGAIIISGSGSSLWICGALFISAMFPLLSKNPLLRRIRILFACIKQAAPNWLRKGEEIEIRVRSFRSRHPTVTFRIFILDLVSQFLMVMEVFVVLRAIGVSTNFLILLGIEAVSRASKIVSAWVPGRVGVDESGAVAACALFGLSPAAGLTLSISRRARDLLWCVAGLIWLSRSRFGRPKSNEAMMQLCD